MSGSISGLKLTHKSTTSVEIGTGSCEDSTDSTTITVSSALTLDATGTGPGGLDSGSLKARTAYAVYVARQAGVVGCIASTDTTGSFFPAAAKWRRIGSFVTNSKAEIAEFTQYGNSNDRNYQFPVDAKEQELVKDQTSATWKTFSLAGYIGANATQAKLFMSYTGASGKAEVRPPGGSVALETSSTVTGVIPTSSQPVSEFKSTPGTVSIFIRGYGEEL